jgi:serine/threonine-protein kinase
MQEGNSPATAPRGDRVTAAQVEAQLELILASPQFAKSERMNRFLRFVVEQALHGRGNDLKEYLIGVEVFDKDPSFDPRIDNNVRTEARRLRVKLAEYYAEAGRKDPVIIDLPKGSYVPRFLAAEPAIPKPAPEVPPTTAVAAVPSRKPWLAVAVIAVLTLAVTTLVWRQIWPTAPAAKFRSIAVLPFLNLNADDENEYFTLGLTEEILNHLAEVPGLKVVARTSSFQFKGQNEDVRAIGKRLNVESVLEGSVRRIGDRLRITPQLISTADGYHVWSESFERDADNLFALQDEISIRVVQALGIPTPTVSVLPPPNSKAYRLYLQGRLHWNRWNVKDLRRSIDLLDEAVRLDPKYSHAYAGLAGAYGVLGVWGVGKASESIAKSRAAAQKAVELDPNSGDGYHVLACLKASWDHDWEGARRDFQRAFSLSPGSADLHNDYAMLYLVPRMRLKEAETEARRAVDLDPLSLRINTDLGSVLYFRRDYDAAIAQFRQSLDLDSSFGNASMQLFKCFLMKRQFAEARSIIEPREKARFPNEFALHMGRLQARSGNLTDARRLLQEILGACPEHCTIPPSQIAWLQVAVGDIDGAFRSLERGSGTIMLQVDPEFDPLRGDPRYRAMLAKMHLTAP